MKSLSNKTEYDDELFYNTITSSLKTIFQCPIEGPYSITSHNDTGTSRKELVIITEKQTQVKAVADGNVIAVINTDEGSIISIEHYNKIFTMYYYLKGSTVKEHTKIKQGEILGYTTELNFKIDFDPSLLFNQEKK